MSRLLLDDDKPAHRSKSVWVGVISALIPVIPGVAEWIGANPEAIGVINGIVIIGLRYVTKVPLK